MCVCVCVGGGFLRNHLSEDVGSALEISFFHMTLDLRTPPCHSLFIMCGIPGTELYTLRVSLRSVIFIVVLEKTIHYYLHDSDAQVFVTKHRRFVKKYFEFLEN